MVAQYCASNLYFNTCFYNAGYNSHRFKVLSDFIAWLNGKQVRGHS
jgi:hypothetical protein